MLILFGKQLLADTSSQEAARVAALLTKHKIPYRQRTILSQLSVMRGANAMAHARANLSMASTDRQQQAYVYQISVKRRDHQRASALIGSRQ